MPASSSSYTVPASTVSGTGCARYSPPGWYRSPSHTASGTRRAAVGLARSPVYSSTAVARSTGAAVAPLFGSIRPGYCACAAAKNPPASIHPVKIHARRGLVPASLIRDILCTVGNNL